MPSIVPTPWAPQGGGSGDAGYLLVPLYAIITLSEITGDGTTPEYSFDCDKDSYSLTKRSTKYLGWNYQGNTLPTDWESFPTAMMIETTTAFKNTDAGEQYLSYLVGNTDPPTDEHHIAALYGDGELDLPPGNANTLYYTPQANGRHTTLVVLNDDVYKYNRFLTENDAAENDPLENFEIIFHGLLVPLPSRLLQEYGESRKFFGVDQFFSLIGRPKWTGYATSGPRRSLPFRWAHISDDDADLLRLIMDALRGGLPVWYMQDLDDNETWMMCRVAESLGIEETGAGSYNASWLLEAV